MPVDLGPSAPGQEVGEEAGSGPHPGTHPIKEKQRAVVPGTSLTRRLSRASASGVGQNPGAQGTKGLGSGWGVQGAAVKGRRQHPSPHSVKWPGPFPLITTARLASTERPSVRAGQSCIEPQAGGPEGPSSPASWSPEAQFLRRPRLPNGLIAEMGPEPKALASQSKVFSEMRNTPAPWKPLRTLNTE